MKHLREHAGYRSRVARTVRRRIERGGERLWRLADFSGLSWAAVAQALSRLARHGELQRLSKGVYYRSRMTAFGPSRPNPAALERLAARGRLIFPAGAAAAGLLGLSTQAARRPEVATSQASLPRKLLAPETLVHTRRPASWSRLTQADAALLDVLRQRGRSSELSPTKTAAKILTLLRQAGRFDRLLRVADTEPPRVRAMLGALGEQLGRNPRELRVLRSLNPLSRFDFGALSALPHARAWQAKLKN
jgi:hypothetical protein